MLNKSWAVLDTLKFKERKIFLKKFHAQRTYESLIFKKVNITFEAINNFYDLIEEEFAPRTKPQQILRLVIPNSTPQDPSNDLLLNSESLFRNSKIEIVDASFYSNQPILQILSTIQLPSGLGEQNYKWADRKIWQNLLTQKNPNADDIIVINDKNEITETSRCNIFLFDAKENLVMTPNLESGCLNGVYRRFVISQGLIKLPELGLKKVIEKNIKASEIKNYSIYLTNSIREVIMASVLN